MLLALSLGAQQPRLGRSVHGLVLDALNRPVPSAIVTLTNLQTKAQEAAITDVHGAFAFHDLQPRVSYQLVAAWQGHHSPPRTATQYSSAQDVRLDLKIPVK
ncbi:MAG TPA: carboxypeptidase-like regulatory domain-containing protein [Terriglobales bacterium]|nr:carboxypeptidase-like regulatory domain-containing protein [Terriglobales bacterium]